MRVLLGKRSYRLSGGSVQVSDKVSSVGNETEREEQKEEKQRRIYSFTTIRLDKGRDTIGTNIRLHCA